MMEEDATTVCGARHRRHGDGRGYRCSRTQEILPRRQRKVARPRVRDRAGKEVPELGELAGATRWQPAARVGAQPDGAERVDPQVPPRGPCPRATWRKRVATAPRSQFPGALWRCHGTRDEAWLASGSLGSMSRTVASHPDRRSACRRNVLMAAIGVDGNGDKHVLASWSRTTENTVVVQALIDNLLAGARSDTAAAVHRRWREGTQQSDPKHLRCGRRHPALPGPQGP